MSVPRVSLRPHRLTVTAVEPVALDGSAVAVTLRVPPALRPVFAFTPGQHVTVRAAIGGAEIRRSYSLCSVPEQLARQGTIRIGIRAVPGGAFSTYASRELRPDTALDVLPPVGNFVTVPDPARRRRYGAVVAGSGITPVLCLASATLAVEPRSEFVVLYGNRQLDSMMFAEDLADLKNRYPRRLNLVPVFSREESRIGLAGGRLDQHTLRQVFTGLLDPRTVREWFLCGPWDLVRGARRVLAEHGVDGSSVHTELFHADGSAAVAAAAEARAPAERAHRLTVLLDGRASTVPVPADGRLLDAALSARPELPYSCKTGVCATCRARVVAGEVRMVRDWALSTQEAADGYVLTCQAVPVSDEVTVDFDVT
ncbi:2Fe-2S iron-sulfur cluster-binding protein [Actinophytocola sediminis]